MVMYSEAYNMLEEGFKALREQFPVRFEFNGEEYEGVEDTEAADYELMEGGIDNVRTGSIAILKSDFALLPQKGDLIQINGYTARILDTENKDSNETPLLTFRYGSRN